VTAPILLIDGRSGSGKSELATAIIAGWPEAQLLRLDDLYPGWDGLSAGSQHVHDEVLAREAPRWRRWHWLASRPAEWNALDPERPLVIEGSGALSRSNRAFADHAIWVELDDETRKARALARDGELYAPHWDRWAAQEEEFIRRESPKTLADVVVDGRDVASAASVWLHDVVWRGEGEAARVGE